jgi:SAM-dependent methyltransferase
MRFEIRDGLVLFHDEQPGSHAMLYGPKGARYPFRDDASRFNDGERRYAWAFEGTPRAGDKIVFTTSDREVVGIVDEGGQTATVKPYFHDGLTRVYVGAGCDAEMWSKRGWLCNDIAEAAAVWPGITIVGPCWSLPLPDNSVDEIMAKGMIEHLTYHEVARAFAEWRRVLKPGGFFSGEVPDVDEYIREYLKMRTGQTTIGGEGDSQATRSGGEPDDFEACTGIDRWLRRALYGWQRWPGDEHRSGWTEELFKFYIEKHFGGHHEIRRSAISFDEDVDGPQRVRHLWARAWK